MMKKISLVASLACTLFASSSALAVSNYEYSCSSRLETRVISIEYSNSDSETPCQVFYAKNGTKKMVWQANQQAGYCESKAQAFVNKQIGWGFDCGLATVSAPIETASNSLPIEVQPESIEAEIQSESIVTEIQAETIVTDIQAETLVTEIQPVELEEDATEAKPESITAE